MKHHERQRGQVVLIALLAMSAILITFAGFIDYLTLYARTQRHTTAAAQALALAEAGIDRAVYALNADSGYAGEAGTALGGGEFSVSVATIDAATKRITSTGYVPNGTDPIATETVKATLSINSSIISFRFGVQVGEDGLSMGNGSEVSGNIFSSGNISGGGTVTGDATVASATTTHSLSGIVVGGTASAHTLSNCTVGGDAKYQTISSCSVGGESYPDSPDAAALPFPISDAQIAQWETAAAAGGTIAGPYNVSGTVTLGPKKINGDLTFANGATLYLSGPVWVSGNVTIANNATVRVSQALGTNGAALIADAVGYTATKGTISISNNVIVGGNGNPGSTLLFVSTNTGDSAIEVNNNASSVVLYAPYGVVEVSNGVRVNQITAYRVELENNAEIEYLSGLANASFSSGPGGSWMFVPGTFAITQ